MTLTGIIISSLEGEAVVTQYTAVFHADGTLDETITYKINAEGKHYLYRNWEAPLANKHLGMPQILFLDIDVPDGTYWYLMDKQWNIYTHEEIDSSSRYTIMNEANRNEAGAYNPNGYAPGEYTVKYWYKVLPPLLYDNEYAHLNLKLASDHIPYKHVRVEIENVDYIEKLYPHPPTLQQSTDKDWFIFTGSSAKNELLEFEFLMTPEALNHIDGYPFKQEQSLKTQTETSNNGYRLDYFVATGYYWVNKIATLLVPIGLYIFWMLEGKEKEYTVPSFLSTIPNKTRKPWIVNLIFKRNTKGFDQDGLHATLLDLHERGYIKVDVEGKDMAIKIINDNGLDQYEARVMGFLQKMARDSEVKTEYMTQMVSQAYYNNSEEETMRARERLIKLQNQYRRLVAGTDNEVASEYTVNRRKWLIPLGLLSILLTIGPFLNSKIAGENATGIFLNAAGYGAIVLGQVIVAMIFPSTLFWHWKGDNYREKLEWDAFRNHLSDFSRLQQYGLEDINMWGSWLVYGTALGVGKFVAEAMQSLKIDYSTVHLVQTYPYWFIPISTADTSMMGGGSGGGGGGGFGGGGGGFGGGGAGVR